MKTLDQRIQDLESHFPNPGTSISRVSHPGGITMWRLCIGKMRQPIAFEVDGDTLEQCVERMENYFSQLLENGFKIQSAQDAVYDKWKQKQ